MKDYITYIHEPPYLREALRIKENPSKIVFEEYIREGIDINSLQQSISDSLDSKAFHFISKNTSLNKPDLKLLLTRKDKSLIKNADDQNLEAIINLKEINELRYINKHLFTANHLLSQGGVYIGRVETYWERKIKLHKRVGRVFGEVIWIFDFIINRVIPKIKFLDSVYFLFSGGKRSAISKAEILGRLVYSGFEIVEYEVIDGLFYFAVRKKSTPKTNPNPTFRPFVKLSRVGKHGKLISVYKLRTMHPYSEYLQDHVLRVNGYNEVGKPAVDFRVARWGKAFRKLWIDELPQLLNVLKGEMKLVGIRPLSKVRFSEFPDDLKEERIKYKPGCFPPYVALCMPDDKGNIEAERIYLRDKANNPRTTDLKYFLKSVYNITTNKIRSS